MVYYYEYTQSGHYDRPRQWLFFALLFTSIIIRFVSQKSRKILDFPWSHPDFLPTHTKPIHIRDRPGT